MSSAENPLQVPSTGNPESDALSREPSFVHLHLHTQYSLLEGAIRVKPLMERVSSLGMPSVAITDTNNLFGAIDFYQSARKLGIRPILGAQVLFAPAGRFAALQPRRAAPSSDFEPYYHHLVLLCKDLKGYKNLCELMSRAYTEAPAPQKGSPPGPRALVDRELLDRYGEGLVVLSGGIKGELSWKILRGEHDQAKETARWFQKRFGEDFYFELMVAKLPELELVNETLYDWGEKMGIPCVGTSGAHYLVPEDAESHEVLQCIDYGKNLDFDRPKSLVPHDFSVKSAREMREQLSRFPGAADQTLKIAEKCDVQFQFKDAEGNPIYHLPNFRPDHIGPEDPFDLDEYFREASRKGLERRFQEPYLKRRAELPQWEEEKAAYRERLESELNMILRTGFAGYFLIVADFINWAKENSIPVGPGRGSGAGSLVAYSLRITDIDPIQYKLLFERFINPERISMPDFDVDFCQDRRGEVIEYVVKKYGESNVSQIITFGKLQARAVVKDVGRVLGLSFAETDLITKLMPDELNLKIKSALEKEPRLRELMDRDERIAKVMDYALKLEGLSRNAGVHAAGVIITEKPIVNYCPLYVGKEGSVVTQFDKDFGEMIGLVKFDFLGLKTLTVIDNAVKLVRQAAEPGSPEESFHIDLISHEDSKVFELIGSGDTDGVFQVESSGMKDLCSRLQPNSIEDLTAINALYRPGPLGSGMVDDFIDRKHGRQSIVYELPILEPILKDTYGVILYQEQVMQIARELAGYSLGQADMLRRAMGKKKIDEMNRHREIFLTGAEQKGISKEIAENIYNLMAKFAEYGFNKSHSAAYAVLTYQTAYLKTYYPAEFMAALMTTEMSNTDKITKYISDARAHQIPVLPPDVNYSEDRFSVEKLKPGQPGYPVAAGDDGKVIKGIRFGLEAIKGVGSSAVEALRESRGKEGPFKSVLDFSKRVSTRKANKKVLESLILAGALDSIAEVNRPSLLASVDTLLEHASDEQEERELGQSSLFDAFNSDEIKLVTPTDAIFKRLEDWPNAKKLAMEKQVVGFYISGHPMDSWQKISEAWLGWNTLKFQSATADAPPQMGSGAYGAPARKEVKFVGLVSSVKEITTKKGSRMAFVEVEDLVGRVEAIFFPEPFSQFQELLKQAAAEAEPLLIEGDLDSRDETAKVLVKKIQWAKEAHRGQVQKVVLRLQTQKITVEQLRELKKSLLEHRGKCQVVLDFLDPQFRTRMELPATYNVVGTPQLVGALNQIFGQDVVDLR